MINPQLSPSTEMEGYLPRYYGIDRLVILPRDPYWLFAYWEVSRPTLENLKNKLGETIWQQSTFQLRAYQHEWSREEQIERFFDIAIQEESDSWYINVPDSDRLYHVEFGRRMPDGEFIALLFSNTVRTARSNLSDIIDQAWQLPDWKALKLFRRISIYHLSSAEMSRRRKQRA